jgi:hypothetical protein
MTLMYVRNSLISLRWALQAQRLSRWSCPPDLEAFWTLLPA